MPIPLLMLIGLGLFLFGMTQLETGIRGLGYNTFKRMLSTSTSTSLGSAGVGLAVTAVLQSSSMVSLLVLAFASAGVLPLYNAIGVVLGANLGTTMTGWIVATIGFKLSLQDFAVPLMGLGALAQITSSRYPNLRAMGAALFGLGLIIFGLDIMKEAVSDLPEKWDLSALEGRGPLLFFIVGTLMAAVIQSSSAVMMITLTALHGGIIDLYAAAALVIGADLGTTSTTILGSIGGSAVKRQLALAHVVFNVTVDLAALAALAPLLGLLQMLWSVEDPLYNLVLFHSSFNLLGLLVFLPLLKRYSQWISRVVSSEDDEFILASMPAKVPEAALPAIADALKRQLHAVIALDLHNLRLMPEQLQIDNELREALEASFDRRMEFRARYEDIKRRESDILALALALQSEPLEPDQAETLMRQVDTGRAMVYSAKTLNDIRQNLLSMRHSDAQVVLDLYQSHQAFMKSFFSQCLRLPLARAELVLDPESLQELVEMNQAHYLEANQKVHAGAAAIEAAGMEPSTLLNVNHEVHHALKNLLLAFGR